MELVGQKLLLVLSDISFHVRPLGAEISLPQSLMLIRSASTLDFNDLLSKSRSNPDAYICPVTDSPTSHSLFSMLESKLQEEIGVSPFTMLEFHDPSNPDHIYILAHRDDMFGLGQFIRSYPLGLFKFSLSCLFERNSIEYIKNLKALNLLLLKEYQSVNAQLIQTNRDLQVNSNLLEYEKSMNKGQKKDMQVANKALQYMNNQMKDMKVMCEFCLTRRKNMLMLPCYHLLGCTECVNGKLAMDDQGLVSNAFACIYCQATVQSCKEVFFS